VPCLPWSWAAGGGRLPALERAATAVRTSGRPEPYGHSLGSLNSPSGTGVVAVASRLGDGCESFSAGPVHVGLLPAAAEGCHEPCGRNPTWGLGRPFLKPSSHRRRSAGGSCCSGARRLRRALAPASIIPSARQVERVGDRVVQVEQARQLLGRPEPPEPLGR
jgi:hypothetical protein